MVDLEKIAATIRKHSTPAWRLFFTPLRDGGFRFNLTGESVTAAEYRDLATLLVRTAAPIDLDAAALQRRRNRLHAHARACDESAR